MVQQSDKDYDIDDGAYFRRDDLLRPDGRDRTPMEAKQMVHRALNDAKFSKAPEIRTNCVRIYYTEGYHIDIPVYREIRGFPDLDSICYEIASDEWKASNPAAVTKWFRDANERESPDETNGRQLRRQVRLIKSFARSRKGWRDKIANGFTITTLITEECYQPNTHREDIALYDTMLAMRNRLEKDLQVMHPVVHGEELTDGPTDRQTAFLLEKLESSLGTLRVLEKPFCTRQKARGAWDAVFNTNFFGKRPGSGDGPAGRPRIESGGTSQWRPVDKRGGGRYARGWSKNAN